MKHSSILAASGVTATGALLAAALSFAAPKIGATPVSKTPAKAKSIKPLPRYVSLATLNTLRALRGERLTPGPRLVDPLAPVLPELQDGIMPVSLPAGAPTRLAQAPRRIRPATIRRPAAPIIPKWVRYPLESQLCGIGLGTLAVDKDKFNRIARYGLFAMHGNPTAIVVPTTGGGGGGGGAATAAAPAAGAPAGGVAGAAAGAAGGATGGAVAATTNNLTVNQTPPYLATLFPASQNGELPDWAAAITVTLDNNHVEWLYNRGSYAMGFVVDRLGYVDAIVCAGIESPIARTQLEDPVHTVKLGDDLRKVLFRYGYPDTLETYPVNMVAGASVGTQGGAAGGAVGGAAAGGSGNGAFQTFEVRYEQSYNVVFTVRYNRVVRIYIFGDPDFFSAQRRQNLIKNY